ncbi:putative nicotinate-nucleotide adenylyltransferase [Pseudomonas amygdali pv. eriobotryae]|uniref:Probable nicotinate-nucleotide adenylyltransferase n=1 Tax=Pseudomonas amygdali pv. eriobotryae TaxID=129137 RepID=A0A0P9QFP7_PSEA0|nr:putative nicotinate-nucleotide adenylyltransferase [Pseudomonas amygdali pv. eriobotryae]KWS76937.1 nicotinate-nicotinamide nucleotide adenylyltransferase [Pseudomonas amygdali pv. eriobotryae]RML97284.1 putative nicotinate-nucleotide adenylyltransferase [Pseudomonas amygdali pv. eriobotryae]RMO62352.1 putative nicotinate-nucleotide adenylyltransferase [Pseudomonas amygdali pv. eriobotryae]GFZ60439.1 putative nicotinate-nucleotide adenylyltransferase [Pseudomonas amygdali pv. eriobotryae]
MVNCADKPDLNNPTTTLPRRIGMLGGTFDPVHIGHLRGALEVAELLELDELRLTPSARPPHRDMPSVTAEDRLAMVQSAVAGVSPLTVDDRELKRDKPSYTLDTLESMRAELAPQDQLFLLLGWDAFCGLPTWHRWEELLEHCHIVVLQRPDADSESPDAMRNLLAARAVSDPKALKGPGGHITFVWQTPLSVSATQIRQLLASGKSVRFLVPDAVLAYIDARGLYRAPNTDGSS